MSLDSDVKKHRCPCGEGTYSAYYKDSGFKETYNHSMNCVNCSTEYVQMGTAPDNDEMALWVPRQEYENLQTREKTSRTMRQEAVTAAQKKCFDIALEYIKEEKTKTGMHKRLQQLCVEVPPLRQISGRLHHEFIDEPLAEYFNFESIRRVFLTLGVADISIENKIQAVEAYDAATARDTRDAYEEALRNAK